MTIYFDMDGTIADLYADPNWLEKLRAYDPSPYRDAAPMLNMNSLARQLNKLQRAGYTIGIISWLSKTSSAAYNEAVTKAKKAWLHQHLHSVKWDAIHIVAYGTSKKTIGNSGILFDDEQRNRDEWGSGAYTPDEIMEVLKAL